MEGENVIITRHLHPTGQPDNLSSYKDVSMTPLRASNSTSNNNLHQVSSGDQQQLFASTTFARYSQEIKRRNNSASSKRLRDNNLSSTPKASNNNYIKHQPLDMNNEPNTSTPNMESPLPR